MHRVGCYVYFLFLKEGFMHKDIMGCWCNLSLLGVVNGFPNLTSGLGIEIFICITFSLVYELWTCNLIVLFAKGFYLQPELGSLLPTGFSSSYRNDMVKLFSSATCVFKVPLLTMYYMDNLIDLWCYKLFSSVKWL